MVLEILTQASWRIQFYKTSFVTNVIWATISCEILYRGKQPYTFSLGPLKCTLICNAY